MKQATLAVALMALLAVALAGCQRGRQGEFLAEGDAAPPFTLTSADGRNVSLADYAGKTDVLLYFHMAYG